MYKSPGRYAERLPFVKTRGVRNSKGQKMRTVERLPLVWSRAQGMEKGVAGGQLKTGGDEGSKEGQ